jgi:DNA sulfur modification protein DndE
MSLVADRKIRPSEEGEKILEKIREFTKLELSVIAKIAISLSLLESGKVETEKEYDSFGKQIRGINLFGEDDFLYNAIFSLLYQHRLTPTEFFSQKSLSKIHLENGLQLLELLAEQSNNDRLLFFSQLVSKVRIRGEVTRDLQSHHLNIIIGKDKQHQDVYLELNNTELHPNPHLAVIGKSGVGKTQFLFHILSEVRSLSERKTHIIFIDYKGDVAANTNFVKKGDFKVFSLPKDMLPINLFQLDSYDDDDIRMSAREKSESFSSIAQKGFGTVQQNVLTQLIISAYEERKRSSQSFPDFKELFGITKIYYEQENKKPDTLYAILEDLSQYNLFWSHNSTINPFASILDESFIVDLSKLPMLKELVAYLIIERFYKDMTLLPDSQVDGKYRQIRIILVIDEAHNYLGQKNPFLEKVIREGRSKGVTVFLASQSPKDFVNLKHDLKEHLEFLYLFQSDNLDTNSVKSLLRVNDRHAKQLPTKISRFKPFECITRDEYDEFRIFEPVKFYESLNDYE